jgi:hypothetical protein
MIQTQMRTKGKYLIRPVSDRFAIFDVERHSKNPEQDVLLFVNPVKTIAVILGKW